MTEPIRYALRKILIAAAIAVAGCAGFAAFTHAAQSEIYQIDVPEEAVEAPPPTTEKPVYRCPKLPFMQKLACHGGKKNDDGKSLETNKQKTSPENTNAGDKP
jgi:hypothetical protein